MGVPSMLPTIKSLGLSMPFLKVFGVKPLFSKGACGGQGQSPSFSINCNFPHSKIQINPPLPSLMIRSSVSDSFAREASGIWSSLVWMLSPTSS